MQYKAIVSFSGKVSMAMGQVRDISDESLAKDLLRAGYIIPLEAKPKEEKAEDVKVEKPKTRRKGNKDGN